MLQKARIEKWHWKIIKQIYIFFIRSDIGKFKEHWLWFSLSWLSSSALFPSIISKLLFLVTTCLISISVQQMKQSSSKLGIFNEVSYFPLSRRSELTRPLLRYKDQDLWWGCTPWQRYVCPCPYALWQSIAGWEAGEEAAHWFFPHPNGCNILMCT